MTQEILDQRAAAVIEANKYLTLGTVDAAGLPWVTPVYFTPDGHDAFYWASSPDAAHSRNLTARPDVSIAIFDSSVPIGGGSAVYFRAYATEVPADELERCASVFAARFPELRSYTAAELSGASELRLYQAKPTEHWLMVRGSDPDYGTGTDSRHPVWPRG
ncbi:pyridoxamine 5'-phosphate oxidase family protein [Kribbella solani]|uniref:Nitroimidazol reductase NimA-like FMN-containing flavoprotein (Pyridoxamine 5'-phosphate oxidase superfamily) n=1 Tax=Kribbella solani TaxID=236067 RepID=A0A841DIK7_9ACTN|nr:pyridoxamine 5'-phosphate oxidase family protein [Kribbella solani]MBB5976915.1 nitroimidazol reductase NimA-like FMN-containing flavoprotein (pyridoxamine 5'-phosphate oxidase superfamily) [Kribbella solani]